MLQIKKESFLQSRKLLRKIKNNEETIEDIYKGYLKKEFTPTEILKNIWIENKNR